MKSSSKNALHFGSIQNIILSPDKTSLLSLGSDDGVIMESSLDDLTEIHVHDLKSVSSGNVTSIVNRDDNSFIFTSETSNGVEIFFWFENSQKLLFSSDEQCKLIAIDNERKILAITLDDDKTLVFYDINSEKTLRINIENPITMLSFSHSGKYLVTYDLDQNLIVYSTFADNIMYRENVSSSNTCISWGNNDWLFISFYERSVKCIDILEKKNFKIDIPSHKDSIVALCMYSTDKILTIDSSDLCVFSQYITENMNESFRELFSKKLDISETISCVKIIDDVLYICDISGSIIAYKIDLNSIQLQHVSSSLSEDHDDDKVVENTDEKKYDKIYDEHAIDLSKILSDDEDSYDYEMEVKNKRSKYVDDYAMEDRTKEEHEDVFENENVSENYSETYSEKTVEKASNALKKVFHFDSETESSSYEHISEKEMNELKKIIDLPENIAKELDQRNKADELEEEDLSDSDDRVEISEIYSEEDMEFSKTIIPGSTKVLENNSRYLCWNDVGMMILRQDEDEKLYIDVKYSDKIRYSDKTIENRKNYELGMMNDDGILFASTTTVTFQYHNLKTGDFEISNKVSPEKITSIALGKGWYAVVTDRYLLHIYSYTGFELSVISTTNEVASISGSKNKLVIVYDDNYSYKLFDVEKRHVVSVGVLPFLNSIQWIGFDNKERLYVKGGTNQTVYQLVDRFGYQWIPILDIKEVIRKEQKRIRDEMNGNNNYATSDDDIIDNQEGNDIGYTDIWVIYMHENVAYYVFLENKVPYPSVLNAPSINSTPLKPITLTDKSHQLCNAQIQLTSSSSSQYKDLLVEIDNILIKDLVDSATLQQKSKVKQIAIKLSTKQARIYAIEICNQNSLKKIGDQLKKYYDENEIPAVRSENENVIYEILQKEPERKDDLNKDENVAETKDNMLSENENDVSDSKKEMIEEESDYSSEEDYDDDSIIEE